MSMGSSKEHTHTEKRFPSIDGSVQPKKAKNTQKNKMTQMRNNADRSLV